MENQETKQEREGGRAKSRKARASWLLSPKREGGRASNSTAPLAPPNLCKLMPACRGKCPLQQKPRNLRQMPCHPEREAVTSLRRARWLIAAKV